MEVEFQHKNKTLLKARVLLLYEPMYDVKSIRKVNLAKPPYKKQEKMNKWNNKYYKNEQVIQPISFQDLEITDLNKNI